MATVIAGPHIGPWLKVVDLNWRFVLEDQPVVVDVPRDDTPQGTPSQN